MSYSAQSDRRQAARRTCLLSGSMRFITRDSTLGCRIRNLSETGARVQVTNSYWVPDRFELEIAHHDIRVPAKVVWRTAEELGIRFEANRRGMMTSAKQEDNVIRLKAERERLQQRVRELTEE